MIISVGTDKKQPHPKSQAESRDHLSLTPEILTFLGV